MQQSVVSEAETAAYCCYRNQMRTDTPDGIPLFAVQIASPKSKIWKCVKHVTENNQSICSI